ncbi:MAG: hypothetical protein HDR04_05720 [Lachnospiraceae bacterium]|nr:hypothetical protein [Lachnospiraceae bacterium]
MENIIDIHSHILPGADDGSDSFEMSMKMLKCAADDGISGMILTPHNKPGHRHMHFSKLTSKIDKLREMMSEENINIELHLGSELYYRSGILEEMEEDMAGTLAGSRYALVEFNPLEDYDYIRNGIYSLLMGGYSPVLAHAERYRNVCTTKYGVDDLIEMGCYIQVNAGSIMGEFGSKTKRFVKNMLKQRQVHFVATDAHDLGKRAPYLSGCAELIRKKYGEDYSEQLFCKNPLYVIRDKEIVLYL